MTITPCCDPPSLLRLSDANISPVTPALSRGQPSALPSTRKTQIARRDITLPPPPRATDTTRAALAPPPSQSGIEESNEAPALNPRSLTAPLAQNSRRGFLLQAFGTPASVHPVTPRDWQASENP